MSSAGVKASSALAGAGVSETRHQSPNRPGMFQSSRRSSISVEEIEIGSSDSSDDVQDSFSAHALQSGRRYRVVTPPPFDMSGPQSLKKYLGIYERYFRTKFHGGQPECSMELANFLQGEALAAYKAFGGHEKRYPVIKERLLDWYKTQKVLGAKGWRNELRNMKMEENESFKVLAICVQEAAQRALPHDTQECARRMFEVYSQAVPSWFRTKLSQRLEI